MKTEWLSFEKARSMIHQLKLKKLREWSKYIKGKTKLLKIPHNPYEVYKKDWANMGDWLGTGNKRGGQRRYSINEDFFKKWSNDMAYVFGLWFADGCIVEKHFVFSICLHSSDKYLLENVFLAMESTHPVRTYNKRNASYFSICSEKIVKDIIKLGGKYRKSLDCEFPDIPKQYLPDFIRGLWDGDGTVYLSKEKNGYNSYRSSICSGSKSFILKLSDVLKEQIPNFHSNYMERHTKKTWRLKKDKNNLSTLYCLNCGVNNTRRLRDFIYNRETNLKMTRKHDLFVRAGGIEFSPSDKRKHFLSYPDAIKLVHKFNIKSYREWNKFCSLKLKPKNIPSCPRYIYKEWVSYKEWLGINKWDFITAHNYVKGLNLKSSGEWYQYVRSKDFNKKLPYHPDRQYKDCGWENMQKWLGVI